ncbi:TPA: hypothetical protein MFN42_003057 [Klebsiella quasipneumoniae subsp. quasipneumoniae]|nr:hypothetical protein [Klebsiella quasipneumoniae subsp. quasipneumoniae]
MTLRLPGLQVHRRLRTRSPAKAFTPQAGTREGVITPPARRQLPASCRGK